MSGKNLLALLLTLALVFGLMTPAMAGTHLNGALIILHTNDIHGRAVADPETGAMGYAAIAQTKQEYLNAGASVLLLDAGDASQGTPLVNLSMGKTAFELMNAVGYDAMAPGNHEFDWGLDNMLQNRDVAEFPVLAANITDRVSGELVFEDHVIFDMPNGMKVGVFGLITPETYTKTNPEKIKSIAFAMGEELYACAQAQVDALVAENCDLIVALGHLGVAEESVSNRSIDVLANVTGIDVFIDGHSHTVIDEGEMVGEALLVSAGEYAQNIGVVLYTGDVLEAWLEKPHDSEIAALVNSVNDEVNALLSAAFAVTEVDLNGERDPGVRTEETNLGDFAADAILWAAQQAVGDTVVAAVTNGGGIRASIPAGEITMLDMKTIFPFGNEVATLMVTGAELLEALEAATFSTPTAIGAFPQVAGIEFTIDTGVEYVNGEMYEDSTYYKPANPGSRVTIQTVGGEPFDPEAVYTIATNDFMAVGGDTYKVFIYPFKTSGYITGLALEDALVSYVTEALGGVVGEQYAAPQGRITIR